MSHDGLKMSSYIYGIFADMRANERRLLEEGPKDADGRPMPSAFARACEARKQLEERVEGYPNIVILQTMCKLR